ETAGVLGKAQEGAGPAVTPGRVALAAASFLAVVAPALAAEPFDGRWAADPSACAGEGVGASPTVVTSQSLTWPGATCTVGTSYRVWDALHIGARWFCEGMVSNVAIKLAMRGGRLILDWPRA